MIKQVYCKQRVRPHKADGTRKKEGIFETFVSKVYHFKYMRKSFVTDSSLITNYPVMFSSKEKAQTKSLQVPPPHASNPAELLLKSRSTKIKILPYCEISDSLCDHCEEGPRTAPGVPTCLSPPRVRSEPHDHRRRPPGLFQSIR